MPPKPKSIKKVNFKNDKKQHKTRTNNKSSHKGGASNLIDEPEIGSIEQVEKDMYDEDNIRTETDSEIEEDIETEIEEEVSQESDDEIEEDDLESDDDMSVESYEEEIEETEMDEEGDDERKCIYNNTKKKNKFNLDEEIILEDNLDEDDDNSNIRNIIVPPEERITTKFMTDYERGGLLGIRTNQLARGAKPQIKNTLNLTPLQIALEELKHKVIPIKIKRPLPNGMIEVWCVSELII